MQRCVLILCIFFKEESIDSVIATVESVEEKNFSALLLIHLGYNLHQPINVDIQRH